MADGSIIIEIKGDSAELQKALENLGKTAKSSLNGAFDDANKSIKNLADSASRIGGNGFDEAANAASEVGDSANKSAREVENLDEAMDRVDGASMGEATSATEDLSQGLKDAANSADDLGDELGEAGDSGGKLSDIFKGTFFGGLAAKGVELAVSAVQKLGQAVIDVGKQAVNSYAQYEQLVGGVDTLFKESSATVQKYAAEAYKTAGMSANAYMENVTAFSASLIQGLGGDTAKAAELANQAVIDMSD